MVRSLRTPGHLALMQVLIDTRKDAGLTQPALANRLKRPQSYIAKIENGERRLDVVEFAELLLAIEVRPEKILDVVIEAVKRG